MGVTACTGLAGCNSASKQLQQPNVVFILADDIGERSNIAAEHTDMVEKYAALINTVKQLFFK